MSIQEQYFEAIKLVLEDSERQLLKLNKDNPDVCTAISNEKNEIMAYILEYKGRHTPCTHRNNWKFAINLTD